jgi:DNA replication protein DnaC
MSRASKPEVSVRIAELLSVFKLPTAAEQMVRRVTEAGHADALPVVCEVLEVEAGDRHERRVDRLRRTSKLPPGKTFATLKEARLPRLIAQKAQELAGGTFLADGTNVLCFGLPGTGKSHVACAIADALLAKGHAVLFAPAYQLVQQLLAAKRDLVLPSALRKLDIFDAILLDDIGYVQQSPDEAEVLFTLLAERYERRSLIITSNLVFSQWERIFKNPLSTAAAIDRIVHHSVILEFDGPSYRAEEAEQRSGKRARSSERTRKTDTQPQERA